MKRAKTVDAYIADASQWQDELRQLREILRSTKLTEEVKWGGPCYTWEGKNIVGLAGFKSYFGLWFLQGALLKDKEQVLINAQQGKTKALRQWRMTSASDINRSQINRYLNEAISLAKEGKAIKSVPAGPVEIPPELKNALRREKGATAAFGKTRPGLQREFANYISDAKREDTKLRRIQKILPMIIAGKGLNDKYR